LALTAGRRRRRRRPATIIAVLAAVTVVVAWGAVAAKTAAAADADARAGLNTARQAQTAMGGTALLSAGGVTTLLDRAETQFRAAQRRLSSWWLAPAGAVPGLDRQLSTAQALARAGVDVLAIAQVAVNRLRAVNSRGRLSGPQRVSLLDRLASVAGGAAQALDGLDLGSSSLLLGPVARSRDKVAEEVAKIRHRLTETGELAGAAAILLRGPSTVLVLAANNGEMRSGSGAFLEAGAVDFQGGSAHFSSLTQTADLYLGGHGVPITGDFAARWGWMEPNIEWRDLGLTPDFPTTAALAARMWKARTGQGVQAVVSVDIAALGDLLAATGPVDWQGQTVDAANVQPLLLHDQYAGLNPSQQAQLARVDRLGSLASDVLRAVTDGRASPTALARRLSQAAAGRHMMMWSADPAMEAAWTSGGLSGAASPRSLMVSVINRGANKLDPYLAVDNSLTARPSPSGTQFVLDITIRNQAPPGLPPYIVGTEKGLALPPGGYEGILSVNLPGRAGDYRVSGYRRLAAEGAEGPMAVLAVPIDIPRGSSHTYKVLFDMAGRHGALTVMPSARIPPEEWSYGNDHFYDTIDHSVSW
jgi:hypothetical protein